MPKTGRLTPMLRQYLEVKEGHQDAVLLYRMGDFYELFFEDAVRAAPILEVTLTARNKGSANEAPMCGVPHHALEVYLGKLVRAGLKVAICDQVEDPAEAKGLVKREVTRVVTPGTVSDPELLDGKEANFLASLAWNEDGGGGAFLDVSTGRFTLRRWSGAEEAVEELSLLEPREVLFTEGELPESVLRWVEEQGLPSTPSAGDRWVDGRRAGEVLQRQLGAGTLKGYGLAGGEPVVRAAAVALSYARETQKSDLSHVSELSLGEIHDNLVLDATTVANLELYRDRRGVGRKGTLIHVLDRTVTSPGGRKLKEWLRRPLRDVEAITERHAGVAELLGAPEEKGALRTLLEGGGRPGASALPGGLRAHHPAGGRHPA